MGFEILSEGELFGETESFGDFLDLQIWLHKQVLGLVDGEKVNPLLWRLA